MHKALFSACIRTLGTPRGSDCPEQPWMGVAPSAPSQALHLHPSVCPSTWAVPCLCSAGCMSPSLPWLPAGPQPCSPLHLGLGASGPCPVGARCCSSPPVPQDTPTHTQDPWGFAGCWWACSVFSLHIYTEWKNLYFGTWIETGSFWASAFFVPCAMNNC